MHLFIDIDMGRVQQLAHGTVVAHVLMQGPQLMTRCL
jgi:hypothetical protein